MTEPTSDRSQADTPCGEAPGSAGGEFPMGALPGRRATWRSPWLYGASVCLVGSALLTLAGPAITSRQAQLDKRRLPETALRPASNPAWPVATGLIVVGAALYGRYWYEVFRDRRSDLAR